MRSSSADDFHVVLQTLQADLATDYLALRSLDAQDQTLEDLPFAMSKMR